jgi:plastocyanin
MAPTPQPPGGPTPTTVAIVGQRGAQSFTPSPATIAQGQMLAFRNNDNVVHRIVFNDNSFDSGNINPGATSDARAVPTNGANYHCSLHPGMIGSIAGSTGQPPPPCTGEYC